MAQGFQTLNQLILPLHCQLSSRRGRRSPQISHEISDGEVGFVTNSADNRLFTGSNGPGHLLFVERPQIFHTSATTAHDDHLSRAETIQQLDGGHNLSGGMLALHRGRTQIQLHRRIPPPCHPGDIMHHSTGFAGNDADAAHMGRQRLFQ